MTAHAATTLRGLAAMSFGRSSGKKVSLVLQPRPRWYSSSTTNNADPDDLMRFKRAGELAVKDRNGRPSCSLPLPKAGTTVFTLNTAQPLWRFLKDVQTEDDSVTSVKAFTADGEAYADSTPIGHVLKGQFQLSVNSDLYVLSPNAEVTQANKAATSPELRELVEQLHASLQSREATRARMSEVSREIDALRLELAPLEAKRQKCEVHAKRMTTMAVWTGLAYMSLQWGFLVRLTWWEYSWDLMEPVVYFIGTGTSVLFAAFYVLHRQEYAYQLHGEQKHLHILHKKAHRMGLDVERYNTLQTEISKKESQLQSLQWRL